MKLLLIVVFVFFGILTKAQLKSDDVKSFTLQNGMKFLIIEDNSIPNANMY